MDILTKSNHFILIKIYYLLQKLAKVYISEILNLYGIPSSIILNRDPRFMSRFWESLQEALNQVEAELCLPSADGQSYRKNYPIFERFA